MMLLYNRLKQIVLRQYYRHSFRFQRLSMNQRIVSILLLTIFFFGLIIIYRSYHTSDSTKVVSNNPVRVDFFVMSRCPDARICEILFAPSLLKLSSIINFTVSYIAQEIKPNEFNCMHGPGECLGNKQQLCVQSIYSQVTLIKFLQCQSKRIQDIPNNGEICLKKLSDHTLKWSNVETCVSTNRANKLFHQSLEKTRLASVTKSCTMHLNGKFWCMHDGTWYGCSEGYDERSFIKSICSRYNGPNKPIECS